MTFGEELRKWRGNDLQKQVCDVFGVPLVTYQKWEQGVNVPKGLAMEQVRWRMSAHKLGVSVEVLRASYLSVIQKVALEIESRK